MPAMDEQQMRRSEDRDRALNTRLDQLERAYQTMTATVTQLESSVNVVKLEQSHLKEIFEARLRVIEKNQEIQISKFDDLRSEIQSMAGEPEKTPAGRIVLSEIRLLHAAVKTHSETLLDHAAGHLVLEKWKDNVEGVLLIMKWVGAGGLVALGFSILRLLKMLP